MQELYYVVSCSEDGDTSLSAYTKEALERALAEQDWGSDVEIHTVSSGGSVDLQTKAGIFIIKGTSVVPKEKAVVTKWSV